MPALSRGMAPTHTREAIVSVVASRPAAPRAALSSHSAPGRRSVALQVCAAGYRSRDGHALVSPVQLSLEPGRRLAIVGPNGAGKSTLLRMLAGVLAPTQGQVLLDGSCLYAMPPLVRARKLALLTQTDQVDARLRVADYVALGCLPHRPLRSADQLRETVAEALACCQLKALAGRAIGSLSGGERQRVHLARSLAQQPGLLLLDEPTNHLDPRATLDLLGIVRDLGVTVVAVLHDLSLVLPWAEQVAVLQNGDLVRQAPPAAALDVDTVRRVFAMPSYHLPHPATARRMLVLDPRLPVRSPILNHDLEAMP